MVRVRGGIRDPDFPAIGLGGWSGRVLEVNESERPPLYLVEWDERTLEAMHPAYRERGIQDGLVMDEMWLNENELEADQGGAPAIEPISEAALATLRTTSHEARIRAILGGDEDGALPVVNAVNLERYHVYLASHLLFPFEAWFWEQRPSVGRRKFQGRVTRLLDPAEQPRSLEHGVLAEIRRGSARHIVPLVVLVVPREGVNQQLVEDYAYWFSDSFEEESLGTQEEEPEPTENLRAALLGLLRGVGWFAVLGTVYGLTLATAAAALAGALLAAEIGAGLGVLLGGIFGWLLGKVHGSFRLQTFGSVYGVVVLAMMGGLVGALLGVLVAGFLGAVPGAIAGGVMDRAISWWRGKPGSRPRAILAGAVAGTLVVAFLCDAESARAAVWLGGLAGAIGGPVMLVLVGVLMVLKDWQRSAPPPGDD
jgi:Calcium binding